MNDRTNRTFICSIAFLDIVDYSQRVAREQLELKERFNQLIGEVIKDIAQNDRVVIDTGDGAALCFMGDPEDALFVVMNLRDRLRTPENEALGLQIRIGINLGPVRLIHDINGHPNVLGDGINVAARVMSFAEPNQIMVSRSYFEVVSRLSQEYTRLFNYAGARTDKHVREHEVYEVGPSKEELASAAAAAAAAAAAPPAAAPPAAAPSTEAPAQPAAPAPTAAAKAPPASAAEPPGATPRNKWLVPGAIAAAVLLALAVFIGMPKSDKTTETAKAEATAVPGAEVKSDQSAAAETKAEPSAAAPAGAASGTTAADKTAAAAGSTTAAATGPLPGPTAGAGSKSAAAAKAEAEAAAVADLMAKGLIPKGKATDPAAGKGKDTDPLAAKGKATDPSTAKGKDGDPLAAKGKATDPSAAKGKGADPLAAKGKAPDAVDRTKALPTLAADKSAPKTADAAAAAKKAAEPPKAATPTPGTGTGTLEFWISPFGDVVIDGKQVGSSPPLKVYKIPAGIHKIEIHNTTSSFPHVVTVDVKENQVVRINKTFREY